MIKRVNSSQFRVMWIDTNITHLLNGLCGQHEFDQNTIILNPNIQKTCPSVEFVSSAWVCQILQVYPGASPVYTLRPIYSLFWSIYCPLSIKNKNKEMICLWIFIYFILYILFILKKNPTENGPLPLCKKKKKNYNGWG